MCIYNKDFWQIDGSVAIGPSSPTVPPHSLSPIIMLSVCAMGLDCHNWSLLFENIGV